MLSIVTDEISLDPETAVSLAWRWGVRKFELRHCHLKRAPYYDEPFYEMLPSLRKQYPAIQFVAVSPGVFKIPADHRAVEYEAGLKMDESFRLAEMVGCRLVVIFGFDRPKAAKREKRPPQRVLDVLGRVAGRAAAHGFTLAVEIEDGSYADGGTAAAEMVEAVGSPALGVNFQRWTPEVSGDSWDAGFERVRRHIRHMHYHGINAPELGGAGPGQDLGWAPKIRALLADGYAGCISAETHLKPRLEKSEITVAALKRVLAEAGAPT
ncbi:MAG: TIM barrel protein [Planctomycetota bacterium]